MTPEQVGQILALAAARDARKVGKSDILSWYQDVGDLDFDDAAQAVSRHYQATTDRLMPAHLRAIVADIDRERRRAARERAEQATLEADAASRRRDRSIDVGNAVARLGEAWSAPVRLPSKFEADSDRDARLADGVALARAALPPRERSEQIHDNALAQARREHGKPVRPDSGRRRNPNPKPIPPVDADVAGLARRYLIDGYTPAKVAELLAVDRRWCEQTARWLRSNPPARDWCGKCTYEGRMRKPDANSEPIPCPDCHPDVPASHDAPEGTEAAS